MQPKGNDWVVLYSSIQKAYHVERMSEYQDKGPGAGGYRIVDRAGSYQDAMRIVADRKRNKDDK